MCHLFASPNEIHASTNGLSDARCWEFRNENLDQMKRDSSYDSEAGVAFVREIGMIQVINSVVFPRRLMCCQN